MNLTATLSILFSAAALSACSPAPDPALGQAPRQNITETIEGAAAKTALEMAKPVSEAVQKPIQTGIDPFIKHLTDNAVTNQSFTMVQLLSLDKLNYKVVRTAKCAPHADLVLAAIRSTSTDATTRAARLHDALLGGYNAGCFVEKTQEDKLSSTLRDYWKNNRAKVRPTQACQSIVTQSDAIALAIGTESEKNYYLTKLFATAQTQGCMSPI